MNAPDRHVPKAAAAKLLSGNAACAQGAIDAGCKFFAGYPITPASDILHQLSSYKHLGIKTVQSEDEIAAIGAAVGAAYGGAMGMTTRVMKATPPIQCSTDST